MRVFPHTTLYFQVYLLFSNANVSRDLDDKVIEVLKRVTVSVTFKVKCVTIIMLTFNVIMSTCEIIILTCN